MLFLVNESTTWLNVGFLGMMSVEKVVFGVKKTVFLAKKAANMARMVNNEQIINIFCNFFINEFFGYKKTFLLESFWIYIFTNLKVFWVYIFIKISIFCIDIFIKFKINFIFAFD
jgi:hypothetical protein